MDDQRLREIKERCERASKGDWDTDKDIVYRTSDGKTVCIFYYSSHNHFENYQANFEFVAHARQDIPDLVAEVERLKIELTELEQNLANIEWSSKSIDYWEQPFATYVWCCPVCKGLSAIGHKKDCWLGKALGRV